MADVVEGPPDGERKPSRAEMLALVEQHLGPEAAADLRLKLDDSDRIAVIRDAFLDGRDAEAVTLLTELDRWGKINEGVFRPVPISSPGAIEPGLIRNLVARPQSYAFRGVALLVSEMSRNFSILDIRVGGRSMLLQAGDLPADIFTPIPPALEAQFAEVDKHGDARSRLMVRGDVLSRIVPLDFDVCLTSMELSVFVRNDDARYPAGLQFRAFVLGKEIPSPHSRRDDRGWLAGDAQLEPAPR